MPPRMAATGPVQRRITPPPEARRDDWLSLPASSIAAPMIATMAMMMKAPTRMPPPICLSDSRKGKLAFGVIPGSTAAKYMGCSVRCIPWSEQMSSRVHGSSGTERHDFIVPKQFDADSTNSKEVDMPLSAVRCGATTETGIIAITRLHIRCSLGRHSHRLTSGSSRFETRTLINYPKTNRL